MAVTVFLAPGPFGAGGQFFDQNGNPLALGQITTYLAGTTTPAATYTGPGLTQVANPNPIILGPDGRPPQEIWIPQGVAMKFIVADALGSQVGPTYDNLSGVNDTTLAVSEWIPLNLTPTQLSATSFSVPGNLTGTLHADRRILTVNGAGTLYGAVVSSSFAAGVTTVVVRMDTGQALDAGLSAVSYGFVSAFPGNTSIPMAVTNPITGSPDATKRLFLAETGNTCNGRLTLTTGTPVTVADVLAATTIFFTPYLGNKIATFNGSGAWTERVFTEKSVAVPASTNTPFDIFIVDGTLALETVNWTNDTTRAIALVLQDGVLVKSGQTTRRYLGTGRTTAVAGQTEDSVAKRYLWNCYNRMPRKMFVADPTAIWTYTLAAFRQANGAAGNQLDMVIGISEQPVTARVDTMARNTNAAIQIQVGIGVDSTTVNSADIFPFAQNQVINIPTPLTAQYTGFPGIGRHTLTWLEFSGATGTTTWHGTSSPLGTSGITGTLIG